MDGLYAFIAVVLTVLIDVIMLEVKIPVLTFPFVLASWIVIVIKKMVVNSCPACKAKEVGA